MIIQKYEMVYVLKQVFGVTGNLFFGEVCSHNQMPADNVDIKHIYHICDHIFGEVIVFFKAKRNFISSSVICLSWRKYGISNENKDFSPLLLS